MYVCDIETSIKRILTTPLGSRVLEPTFGSRLYELVDKRPDKKWQMLFTRYVYEAVEMWERRVRLQKVQAKQMGEVVSIELEYLVVDENEIVKLEILWK
ncbi:MAG: GPW/gp25 family protein [Sulfurospirillum sp.]|nr:GPW/gp25 family protein [Sulfurospirillum sp.]